MKSEPPDIFPTTSFRHRATEAADPHYDRRVKAPLVYAAGAAVLLSGATATVRALQPPGDPQAIFDNAVDSFFAGNVEESAAHFDALVTQTPQVKPQLWQRGIVLYYVGRYDDCREQFEAHRTVNPNDVENAAWHFLCVARAESSDRAQAELLPVGPDPRSPMREIYGLFNGSQTADEVMAAANGRPGAEFYAHLYVGLYAEARGDRKEAIAHISEAAAERYARAGGYMHTVARVHLSLYNASR